MEELGNFPRAISRVGSFNHSSQAADPGRNRSVKEMYVYKQSASRQQLSC